MSFQRLRQILGMGVVAAGLGACGESETGTSTDGPGGASQPGGADNAGGSAGPTGGSGGAGAAGGESLGGSGNQSAMGGAGGEGAVGTGGVGGDPCVPTSCAAAGADCGNIPDGCGDDLFCGTCAGFETCGGSGQTNTCGCAPTTCLAEGADCGVIPDGCGFSINCGGCVGPETCGGTGTPNLCGCTPTTCATLGKNCGTVPDGCGGVLSCGTCSSPLSCAGAGVANVCGCVMVATATAPASAVTGESFTQAGFEEWNSPSSLQFADSIDGGTNPGTRAWSRLTGSVPISEKLVARNFGFALPDEAVILGIQVQIRRKQRDKFLANWNMFDNAIHLVLAGTNASVNKAVTTDWPTLFTNAVYGGASDVWGGTWSASEINDPSFGVGIRAQWTGQAGNNDAEVDHVQMTVTYQACQ